jgi:hypothetical protein
MIRIANGAGFLGDSPSAPRRLVEGAEVDVLTLEYLAELTMSILARLRAKDPNAGYANDLIVVLEDLLPALRAQPQLKIVTNGGGVNPIACAKAAGKLLTQAGFGDEKIGVVTGDDILSSLGELERAGQLFDAETCEPIDGLHPEIFVSANAYFGAQPIAEALAEDPLVVITGRVADASLTVGPAMQHFGGDWQDWNQLAAFSVAGHLIECGAQVTGGYSTDWKQYDLLDIGYPIAEVEADGSCVITKPASTGGAVNRRTVIEQLTYEIGDPRHYLTPDVDVDFTSVSVSEVGQDRVRVSGATGNAAPPTYKVSTACRGNLTATGELLVYGPDAIEKAHACVRILERRLKANLEAELLGTGISVPREMAAQYVDGPAIATGSFRPPELMLRITTKEKAEQFSRELASLITSGPAGLAGYAAGRPAVRQTYLYKPMLVAKEALQPRVEVRAAAAWANG